VKAIFIDPRQQWLYVINGRALADVFSLRDKSLNGRYKLLEDGDAEITASTQLVGGISLIVGNSKGGLAQWFMARDPDGEQRLKQIRTFEMGTAPIVEITAEERRKGFTALDASGKFGVFHSTAHRTLLVDPVVDGQGVFGLSPRANRVIVEAGGKLQPLLLDNPHPEVSWSALWSKVWYENYDEPKYVWQSTAANTDFEPKMSLAPLTFGTLKAAFYAMLLAAPLAVAAAIYTAYFMAPGLRRKVKPVIELMEAMPTVILGFFAGLFLAPYVEGHLPGIFSPWISPPGATADLTRRDRCGGSGPGLGAAGGGPARWRRRRTGLSRGPVRENSRWPARSGITMAGPLPCYWPDRWLDPFEWRP